MIRLHRDILKAVEPMVKAVGGTVRVENASGKKHNFRLEVNINGVTKYSPLACTPKLKDFAIQHKINDVKKIIKEIQNA